MIESLSGVVTIGFILAAALSLQRAREGGDRFFIAFAFALALLAVNQLLALKSNTSHRAGQTVTACFDLPKGDSTLELG